MKTRNAQESVVPSGFESFRLDGSSGTFSYENLKNQNKELVLISAPSEFDINKLKGEQIVLHGSKILSNNESAENENVVSKWELHSFLASSDKHLNILLPSDTQHKHVMSDPLSVTLNVVRNLQIPILKSPEKKKFTRLPKPVGLKPRWVPFGSGGSDSHKPMRKSNESMEINKGLNEMEKKKKRKKKAEDGEDGEDRKPTSTPGIDESLNNVVPITEESVSDHVKPKKKKREKQNGENEVGMTAIKEKMSEVVSIKVERVEEAVNEEEPKKKKKKKKQKQENTGMVNTEPTPAVNHNDEATVEAEQHDETEKKQKKKKKKFTNIQEKENVKTESIVKMEDESAVGQNNVKLKKKKEKEDEENKVEQESHFNCLQIAETDVHLETKKKKKKKQAEGEQKNVKENGHIDIKTEDIIIKEVDIQENLNNREVYEKKKKKKKRKSEVVVDDPQPVIDKVNSPIIKAKPIENNSEKDNENDQKHKRKRKKRKSLANGLDIKPEISELNLNNTSTLNSVTNTDDTKKRNIKRKHDSMAPNDNDSKKIKMDSNNNTQSANKKPVSCSSDLNSDAEDKLLGVVPKKRAFSN